ncbi:RNA polymerase sigma factor [Paraconexibacter algicola]|uniref:RNA polymerase subunit sigma-70 n=1 Tax=Paraconexibacter algicola TaxID=2133960 RepID=A0A2T4UCY2_9ACTN|nr:RNA polymerase sigma factor [Paraconexibacter algicola]PTL55366.1 RNA polymerase subunit sigma-70 [Paraconexibacter algicola]
MTDRDDIQMLQRSVTQPTAFDALFVRHHAAIRRYLAARTRDLAVAEDLAAETFLRAFAARATFRDQGHGVRAWLFQIATNLLRDHARSSARRTRDPSLDLSQGGDAAPPALPTDPALEAVLRQLPHEQLEALLLHAWADLTYQEIATVLDVRVGTVRSRLHRARAHLTRALAAPEHVHPTSTPQRSSS